MLLRIDDIDTSRARSQYTGAIYEDLRWLGLHWPSPIRAQSNHLADYDAAAHELRERGLLYPCFCTRKTLRLTARGHYAGTCKALSKSDIERRIAAGEKPAMRLNVQKAFAQVGQQALGYKEAGIYHPLRSEDLDDAVLLRKDIGSSYLLSSVIDDAAQYITHVIRGADIQHMTGLQVLLQALLNVPTPNYQHHRLISGDDQEKLSKSKGAPSLRDARAAGTSPKDIRTALGFQF